MQPVALPNEARHYVLQVGARKPGFSRSSGAVAWLASPQLKRSAATSVHIQLVRQGEPYRVPISHGAVFFGEVGDHFRLTSTIIKLFGFMCISRAMRTM